jgi:hypothetical protein
MRKAVFPNDCRHVLHQVIVLPPLPLELAPDVALGFRVNEVDAHGLRLQEALDAVNRLDEVLKLEADAEEHGPRAMPLEVAAAAGDDGLRRELGELAVREVDDRGFAVVEVL